MYPVTSRFLSALGATHEVKTLCTVTPPGGDALILPLTGGRVTCDVAQNSRRQAQITTHSDSEVFEAIVAPGARVRILHGIRFGADDEELVPVFTGELRSGRFSYGVAGQVTVPLVDLSIWLARAEIMSTFTVPAGTTRAAAIAALVEAAMPGVAIENVSTGGGVLATSQTWAGSRWRAIDSLATDGSLDAFFGPAGNLIIRDQPLSAATSPDWTIARLVTSIDRQRPLDRLYNTVLVRPAAGNGSQTWTQQVAQITEITHPRHPSKIGVVPYVHESSTARTASEAMVIAESLIDRVTGTDERLALEMLANPALEGGDLLRITAPPIGSEPARFFQHFVDGFQLDLGTGAMNLDTRSQEWVVA